MSNPLPHFPAAALPSQTSTTEAQQATAGPSASGWQGGGALWMWMTAATLRSTWRSRCGCERVLSWAGAADCCLLCCYSRGCGPLLHCRFFALRNAAAVHTLDCCWRLSPCHHSPPSTCAGACGPAAAVHRRRQRGRLHNTGRLGLQVRGIGRQFLGGPPGNLCGVLAGGSQCCTANPEQLASYLTQFVSDPPYAGMPCLHARATTVGLT